MSETLTKAQRAMLERAQRSRFGSFFIEGGREANIAERLETRGLIRSAIPGYTNATHYITPAGRAALEKTP